MATFVKSASAPTGQLRIVANGQLYTINDTDRTSIYTTDPVAANKLSSNSWLVTQDLNNLESVSVPVVHKYTGKGRLTSEPALVLEDSLDALNVASIPHLARTRQVPIGAIGDSISANGWANTPTGVVIYSTSGQAYLMRTVLRSGGSLMFKNVSTNAQPGFTSQQVLDSTAINGGNQIQAAIANGWKIVPVLLGTNDVPSNSTTALKTLQTNLDNIYGQLLAAGILPVACQIPPRNDIGNFGHTAFNAWISRYAAANGLPLAPYFDALVDPTTIGHYKANYSIADGIHPSALAGPIMGDILWNAIEPHVGTRTSMLVSTNAKPSSDVALLTSNPLFLDDTNSDGIPDHYASNSGSSVVSSLVTAGANIPGNAWKLTSGGTTQDYLNDAHLSVALGDRVYFSFGISAQLTSVGAAAQITTRDQTHTIHQGLTIDADIDYGVFTAEYTHAGLSNNVDIYVQVRGPANGYIQISQLTLLNLTKAGLA